jgi:hypothetical protein
MKRRATAQHPSLSSKKSKSAMASPIPSEHEEAFKHAWNALDNDDGSF